MLTSLLLAQEH